MTPVAALISAVIAGWMVRGPRRAMVAVAPPWLAVLVVQTWTLGSGLGTNPASTISDPAYWIVQVVTLALALGVAAARSDWRSRSAAHSGLVTEDCIAPTVARRRARIGTPVATIAAGALSLAYVLVINSVVASARQAGTGQPPLYGLASVVACVVILIVFGVAGLAPGSGLLPGLVPNLEGVAEQPDDTARVTAYSRAAGGLTDAGVALRLHG